MYTVKIYIYRTTRAVTNFLALHRLDRGLLLLSSLFLEPAKEPLCSVAARLSFRVRKEKQPRLNGSRSRITTTLPKRTFFFILWGASKDRHGEMAGSTFLLELFSTAAAALPGPSNSSSSDAKADMEEIELSLLSLAWLSFLSFLKIN